MALDIDYRSALKTTGDSVKDRLQEGGGKKNLALLYEAKDVWESHSNRRKRRLRNIRYVFGDQWGDLVRVGKELITERQAMMRKKQVPLQNNHLIKIINTLTGLYSKSSSMPVVFARMKDADLKSQMMTNALQTNWDNNDEKELMVDRFAELLLGGVAVVSEEWNTRKGNEDSYTYPVNPSYFFWRSKGGDVREWDADMVGEIRDYTLTELASEIAGSKEDYDKLKALYEPMMRRAYGLGTIQQTDRFKEGVMSWDTPPHDNLCRTYHIWTKESKLRYRCVDPLDSKEPMYRIDVEDLANIELINAQRVAAASSQGLITTDMSLDEIRDIVKPIEYQQIWDQYWHFQMLSPYGDVLVEFDSPFEHGEHPYVWRSFHYINGDIVPFVSSVIDQQRHINRLVMMKDMMMQAGAKGLKFIPLNLIPDDMTRDEFMKQCVEIGGTIFYKLDPKNPQAMPQFFTNNSQDAGFSELLSMQVGFINEITAVSEALQGKSPSNGTTPAARYAMETENSTTAVASLVQKFSSFEHEVALKKMKVMHQYYQNPRLISHKKSNGYAEYSMYEPTEVKDIDFEVAVKDAPSSQVTRMMLNDFVMQLWQSGAINALDALENAYLPGTEDLKQTLRAQLEQVQNGGTPQQIPEELVNMTNEQADPKAVQALKGAMMG